MGDRRRHRAVGIGLVVDEYFREAEIQDLDVVIRGQLDVWRLQVAVDDPLLVSGLEGYRDLRGDRECFSERNGTPGDALREHLTIDELEHEEVRAPNCSNP